MSYSSLTSQVCKTLASAAVQSLQSLAARRDILGDRLANFEGARRHVPPNGSEGDGSWARKADEVRDALKRLQECKRRLELVERGMSENHNGQNRKDANFRPSSESDCASPQRSAVGQPEQPSESWWSPHSVDPRNQAGNEEMGSREDQCRYPSQLHHQDAVYRSPQTYTSAGSHRQSSSYPGSSPLTAETAFPPFQDGYSSLKHIKAFRGALEKGGLHSSRQDDFNAFAVSLLHSDFAIKKEVSAEV
ncbi:hypothetical protein BDK51DRAFT_25613 [Blyttiomyces helicus]|uniref:Uncharacterized protein n=1 Tax=Blyttiomyces helicus TaxID=388810 RepID=A0A4P9W861_9FUNG|nr:hypothetical protein BDK51DRAFT_25613 [Blyttiomyces helicus]|eukprot:RKO88514.1 hypothetical protein BDK51DRAFT_25613 [Blyttiomyces helicus]